jgi:hypothetical protein
MNIKTTTSHAITFTVEAFWSEEGGMGQDQYGEAVQELPQAIRLLELARVATPAMDWKIVVHVTTTTS